MRSGNKNRIPWRIGNENIASVLWRIPADLPFLVPLFPVYLGEQENENRYLKGSPCLPAPSVNFPCVNELAEGFSFYAGFAFTASPISGSNLAPVGHLKVFRSLTDCMHQGVYLFPAQG